MEECAPREHCIMKVKVTVVTIPLINSIIIAANIAASERQIIEDDQVVVLFFYL